MKSFSILLILTAFTCFISCSRKITTLKPTTRTPGIGIVNAAGDGLGPAINPANPSRGAGSEENASNIANNAITKANATVRSSPQLTDTLSDEDFVNKSAVSEMVALKMSREVQKTTANTKVKGYAAMILNDHQQIQLALRKLSGLQSTKVLEAELNTSLQTSKNDFEYVQMMIQNNKNIINLFVIGSKSKNAVTREFAFKYLPTLRKHLEAAQELTKEFSPGIRN